MASIFEDVLHAVTLPGVAALMATLMKGLQDLDVSSILVER